MVRFIRLLAVIVVLALLVPACAPAAEQPMATPAPTVAPTINPDAAQPLTLVLPSTSQSTMIAVNRHYSAVVKRMGWNVDFYTVHESTSEDGISSYTDYVCAQLASGVAKADGYFIIYSAGDPYNQKLDQAKAQGLMYDCVAAAPKVVPQYAQQFSKDIAAGQYGLPLCLGEISTTVGHMAFAVRQDLVPNAPEDFRSYRDVRAFLEQLRIAGQAQTVFASDVLSLIELWAREQGYYSVLADGGIYARLDDPDARPVMLEDIPGCEAMLQDLLAWKEAGVLIFGQLPQDDRGVVGVFAPANWIFSSLGVENEAWKNGTVFPLQADLTYSGGAQELASLQARRSVMRRRELVVPIKSHRAADAMAFVQWLYADRNNADAVSYGQEGADYTLQGERIAFSDAYMQSMSGDAAWPGAMFFASLWPSHIPMDAPKNAESLYTTWPKPKLAAPWILGLYDSSTLSTLENGATVERRSQVQFALVAPLSEPSSTTGLDINKFLQRMREGMSQDRLAILQSVYDKLKAQK